MKELVFLLLLGGEKMNYLIRAQPSVCYIPKALMERANDGGQEHTPPLCGHPSGASVSSLFTQESPACPDSQLGAGSLLQKSRAVNWEIYLRAIPQRKSLPQFPHPSDVLLPPPLTPSSACLSEACEHVQSNPVGVSGLGPERHLETAGEEGPQARC